MQVKQLMEAEALKYGSKDFDEVQAQFEKTYRGNAWPFAYGHKLDRVSKEERVSGKIPKRYFYVDAVVNDWFHVYMSGYAFGITQ